MQEFKITIEIMAETISALRGEKQKLVEYITELENRLRESEVK